MMPRPLICATVLGETTEAIRAERDTAGREADLVELRLDSAERPDVGAAIEGRRTPVMVTCRPRREGGRFAGSEAERREVLTRAIESDAEWVDLEWSAGFEDLVARRKGRGVVLSMHDFTGLPGDLDERVRSMLRCGAEVIKVAVTARRLEDCVRLLAIRSRFPDARMVLLAMGEAGLSSRVLAAKFGSPWTYAGEGIAPGQLPILQLRREFHFDRLSASSVVFGIVGGPARHSVSPAMHNAGFAELGVDAAFLPFPTSDLGDFISFARGLGLSGASVTIPFKVAMLDHLDDADETVRRAGAVNTIAIKSGRWLGTNTDGDGFLQPLSGEELSGCRATILGYGGAARAVAVALLSRGARVCLTGRNARRAHEVATELGAGAGPLSPGSWDLLVNATPAGMVPDTGGTPFPEGRFDGRIVYDLVYNPPETRFMREGAAAGCRVIGGLDMLVAQAQRQAAWWTGRTPSAQVLRDAAVWRLARSHRSPS